MRWCVCLCLLAVTTLSSSQTLERETCDARRSEVDVNVPSADALIGGIFMIREPLFGGYTCGGPHRELIQVYEAAKFAIQRVNAQNIVPGIRLGMKAYDYCGSPFMAVRAAQKFYPQFSNTQLSCTDGSKLHLGILGPLTSNTGAVEDMMSDIPASQISPRTLHPDLSDKSMYPYFLRTGRNWFSLTRVMTHVLRQMNWTRVAVVYIDSPMGRLGYEKFSQKALSENICISSVRRIPKMATQSDYEARLNDLGNDGVRVAVFLGTGSEALTLLRSNVGNRVQWVMADMIRMMSSNPPSTFAPNSKGVIFALPKDRQIPEFENYFAALSETSPPVDNPWLADWYMTLYDCKLPGISYAPYATKVFCSQTISKRSIYTQLPYVQTTIESVYAYAKALRTAQRNRCGDSFNGVCDSLRSMPTSEFHNILKNTDFTFSASDGIQSLQGQRVRFDANGDIINQDFTVYNYNNRLSNTNFVFEEVGSYENNMLTLEKQKIRMYDASGSNIDVTSSCPAEGCRYCMMPPSSTDFYYNPGDINIGVALSAHNAGNERYSCDGDNPYGMAQALAIQYAIENLNVDMPGILNNVRLGTVMLDVCENPDVASLFFNNLLGNREIVRDKYGRMVDPNSVKAIIEGLSNAGAMSFSKGIQMYGLPQVGTVASSTILMDHTKYPLYSRTVESNYYQSIAMANFFVKKGWYYIQAVYSSSMRQDLDMLKTVLADFNICLTAEYEVTNNGNEGMILNKVRSNPHAKVVVMLLEKSDIKEMLETIKAATWDQGFVIVGGESWGSDNLNLLGLEDVANGIITFQPQIGQTSNFQNWINQKQPRTAMHIPWFRELYENAFQCYVDAGSKGDFSNECPSPGQGLSNSPLYEFWYQMTTSINAVYVTAKALDETLKHYCGATYSGVCVEYRAANDSNKILLQKIRSATFSLSSSYQFTMYNGEAHTGVEILNYRRGQKYVSVGLYNSISGVLTISDNTLTYPSSIQPATVSSLCPGVCAECSYLTKSKYTYEAGDVTIGGVFGLHSANEMYPTLCGNINVDNGVQFGLAMHYAIYMINNKMAPVSLNDIKVGGLSLDHCSIPLRPGELISQVYTQTGPLSDSDRMELDTSGILGWITDNTAAVKSAATVTNTLDIPLVSPLASSAAFQDKDEYPNFFRTIQGDVTISAAIAKLAKSLSYNYVNVIYSSDSFGKGGVETFEAVAVQEEICILQKLMVSPSMNASQILRLISFSTSSVTVLWTNGADTRSIFSAKNVSSGAYGNLVFISSMPYMNLAKSYGKSSSKTFFFNIKTKNDPGYINFMQAISIDEILKNSFLYEYYTKLFQCNLPGINMYNTHCPQPYASLTSAPGFAQDNYVVPTINAVYSLVGAMDAVLKDKCGQNYKGICAAYSSTPNINQVIMDKMESISFRDPLGNNFEYIDREGNMGMDVIYLNNDDLATIGEFAGASLRLQAFIPPEVSPPTCPPPCQQCIQKKIEFTYIPGDILIGGLFDVHENSFVPFSCGNLNIQGGFQLLEAFNYAIGEVNDKTGPFQNVLKNIKLGGIGLDACQSSIRMGYLVSDVHNGIIKLTRNGITVNPDDIRLYVGGGSSDSSVYLARLLKSLKIPQISYMSSSDSLSDQDRYPYFMRTVPADDKQSLAMVEFLNKNNIRYVQIVHSPSDYGKMGAKNFEYLAGQSKICVAQTVEFPDNSSVTQESADKVVRSLLEKPVANTVIVYAGVKYINEMLKAMTRNAGAEGKFKFIGSETWGNNYGAISGVERLAKGSVTLTLESSDIRDFDTHIGEKSPGNYPENPWFPEFYEEMVNCYLTVPTNRHQTPCLSQTMNIAAQRDYIQDPGILHVINAVFSAAYGLDDTLKTLCGVNYTTVCEQFKNNRNRHNLLVQSVLKSSFVDPSGVTFSFRPDRRDGNKGYVLYDLKERMSMNELGYTYEKIGKFSSQDVLSLDAGYRAGWDGSCERQGSCSECPTVRNALQRYMLQPAKDQSTDGATLLAVLPIHKQGTDPYLCGQLDMDVFYNALAFIYTLDTYFPTTKYKLRGLVVDSCSNNLRVDQDLYSLFSKGRLCNTAFSFDGNVNNKTLAGVITSTTNHVIAANRVLSPLKVPILSNSATSTVLSNKDSYPYFARTVPPDNMQIDVIVRLLKEKNWDSASVIYSADTYGKNLYDYFLTRAKATQTCAGAQIAIPTLATVEQAKNAINYIESNSKSKVIILMASDPRTVLQAAKELNVLDKYVWIGTDSWGTSAKVVQGMEDDLLGSITIEMRSTTVQKFGKYVSELKYNARKGIPDDWFEEFYQMFHRCNIKTAKVQFPQYPDCTEQEAIDFTQIVSQPFVLNTIAATYAYARAIEAVSTGMCTSHASFGSCFSDETAWNRLFENILNVDWSLSSSLELTQTFILRFTNDRFWDIGYNINSFIDSSGLPKYTNIGSMLNQQFLFSADYNTYKGNDWSACRSSEVCDCSAPVVNALTGNDTMRRTKVAEPRNYFFYNIMNTTINNQFVPIYDLTYKWPIWAIAVAVPTCVGLFITIFLFLYLLIFYEIKGGTTLLGFMMMLGIMGIYALNFAFFLPAATDTCGARQFCLGVVYAIVFAALLVKAVDNWRIVESVEYDNKQLINEKYKGLTNKIVLLLMAIGIVCVQLIIPIQWLVHRPPSASLMSEATEIHDWMMCDPHDVYDEALVMSMIFVMFLVLLTGIFSAMSWDNGNNNYESRWILVCSVCTAGCFLVWMIVITNASPPYRDGAVALGNLFNASAILIFTIIRKVVIMLWPQDPDDMEGEKPASVIDDRGNELYSTVFSNAGYDNDDAVFQPSSPRQSELDNGDVGF